MRKRPKNEPLRAKTVLRLETNFWGKILSIGWGRWKQQSGNALRTADFLAISSKKLLKDSLLMPIISFWQESPAIQERR